MSRPVQTHCKRGHDLAITGRWRKCGAYRVRDCRKCAGWRMWYRNRHWDWRAEPRETPPAVQAEPRLPRALAAARRQRQSGIPFAGDSWALRP